MKRKQKFLEFRGHDFDQKYIIHDMGYIFSTLSGEFLKPFSDGRRGYDKVKVYDINKIPYTVSVHRLVMENFNPIIGMENYDVDHLNGIKNDNRIENLQWVTKQENVRRRDIRKTENQSEDSEGNIVIAGKRNIVQDYRYKICEMYFLQRMSMIDISKILNIDAQCISYFLRGETQRGAYSKIWCEIYGVKHIIRTSERFND